MLGCGLQRTWLTDAQYQVVSMDPVLAWKILKQWLLSEEMHYFQKFQGLQRLLPHSKTPSRIRLMFVGPPHPSLVCHRPGSHHTDVVCEESLPWPATCERTFFCSASVRKREPTFVQLLSAMAENERISDLQSSKSWYVLAGEESSAEDNEESDDGHVGHFSWEEFKNKGERERRKTEVEHMSIFLFYAGCCQPYHKWHKRRAIEQQAQMTPFTPAILEAFELKWAPGIFDTLL